jgi:hypothetical protein
MAIYSVNTSVVVGKLESVKGTAETLADADFKTKLINPEMSIEIDYDNDAAKFASGDHAADYAIPGKSRAPLKAMSRLAWSGSYSTPPSIFTPWAASCGHKVVAYRRAVSGASAAGQKVVSVSTTGSPFTQGQVVTLKEGVNEENCTIATIGTNELTMVGNLANSYTTAGYVYTGQALQPLKETDTTTITIGAYDEEAGSASPVATAIYAAGAMGNLEIMAEGAGAPLMVSLDYSSKFDSYEDIANGDVPVFSGNCNEVADTLAGASLTVAGVAVSGISKFALNSGNKIELLENGADGSGYLHAHVADRKPRVSFDMFRGATDAAISQALSATSAELILSTEHFQIRVPKGQPVSPTIAKRNGVYTWDKSYRPLRNCTTAGAALDTAIPVECVYEIIMGRRC